MQVIKCNEFQYCQKEKKYTVFTGKFPLKKFNQERQAKAFLVELSKRWNEILNELNTIYRQVTFHCQNYVFSLRNTAPTKFNKIKGFIDFKIERLIGFGKIMQQAHFPNDLYNIGAFILKLIKLCEDESPYFKTTETGIMTLYKSQILLVFNDIDKVSHGDLTPSCGDLAKLVIDVEKINSNVNNASYAVALEPSLWR